MHDKQSRKYDICVKFKLTKNTCHYVKRQIEPLYLIYIDLANLKGSKNYFVTFIINILDTLNCT